MQLKTIKQFTNLPRKFGVFRIRANYLYSAITKLRINDLFDQIDFVASRRVDVFKRSGRAVI